MKSNKPKKVLKPWGWEFWFAHGSAYAGKLIFIKKGHRLSKQYHRFKHETIYSDQGTWVLEIGGRKRRMAPGQAAVITPGTIHRFTSPIEDVRLIEVSTHQMNDVIRIEDDYGRSKK